MLTVPTGVKRLAYLVGGCVDVEVIQGHENPTLPGAVLCSIWAGLSGAGLPGHLKRLFQNEK